MSNIIRESIDILKSKGWNKGHYYDHDYGFCILGALSSSRVGEDYWWDGDIFGGYLYEPDDELEEALKVVTKVVNEQCFDNNEDPNDICIIAKFNDDENTEWADVLSILEKSEVVLREIV